MALSADQQARLLRCNQQALKLIERQGRSVLGRVPLAGAGLSSAFGFSDWRNLLLDNAPPAQRPDLQALLDDDDCEGAAEKLLQTLGPDAFHSGSSAWRSSACAAHGGVQTEPVHVCAQILFEARLSRHCALQRQHLLAGARAEGNAVSRVRTQTVQWTVCTWRGAGPLARRGLQGQAAACSGLSVRASSVSASLSARYVWPCSSMSTPNG